MRPRTPPRPIITLALTVLLTAAAAVPALAAAGPVRPGREVPAPGHGALDPVVRLCAQRLLVADQVAAAKWGTRQPVDDPVRERQVLAAAAVDARRLGADPEQTVRFFRGQIDAAKAVERTLFASWRAAPSRAPQVRAGTAWIRVALDDLDDRLVHALADTARLRAEPSCTFRVVSDAGRVSAELDLDPVHAAALTGALPPACG